MRLRRQEKEADLSQGPRLIDAETARLIGSLRGRGWEAFPAGVFGHTVRGLEQRLGDSNARLALLEEQTVLVLPLLHELGDLVAELPAAADLVRDLNAKLRLVSADAQRAESEATMLARLVLVDGFYDDGDIE